MKLETVTSRSNLSYWIPLSCLVREGSPNRIEYPVREWQKHIAVSRDSIEVLAMANEFPSRDVPLAGTNQTNRPIEGDLARCYLPVDVYPWRISVRIYKFNIVIVVRFQQDVVWTPAFRRPTSYNQGEST